MNDTDYGLARRMWHHLEPVHAVVYYAPDVFAEAAALGYAVDTRWPSYFAWRAAPLGAAGPRLVTAAFYSFSPAMVAEHVPAAWAVAAPEKVLAARMRAVQRMWRTLLPEQLGEPGLAEAAQLAYEAAVAADIQGRPLAAANADLPWPDEPDLVLWQAVTVLREHRGDGHVAALLAAGLDPCEALVSFAAIGAAPEETFASRGWTPAEWAAARDRLASRGWVDADGNATERGRDGRDEIEWRTDRLADGPWQALGAQRSQRLAELLLPILGATVGSGLFPEHSTLGIRTVPTPAVRAW
jgi:uncharacterized protein YbdZ (MbtH family)